MYMPLLSPSGALGVLGAHSKRKREFTAEDSLVFQDLAHIVANALTREQIEAQLKEAGRLLEVRVRERTAWLEASQEISRAANRAETMTEVMHSSLVALCSGAGWRMGHIFLASKDKPVRPVFHSSWYPKGSGRFLPFERLTRRASASGALSLPSAVLRKGKPAWILPVYPAHPERRGLSRAGRESAWEFSGQFQRLQPPRAGLARQLGIISAAAVPVKAGRDLLGVIEVFSDREIAPRRPLLDMMEQAAAEIGRSAERIQSQERFAAALWREQRSIAQELHDNVGQELTGLGVMSGSLLSTLRRKGRIDASRLKHLTEGLQITLEKLRNVTHGLFPVEVNPTGLQAALARLARQTRSRFGVHCTLRHGANVPVPSREAATHLYRIAQEAVTNAVRHAMARRIHISLVRSARIITLTIRDDGRGLPQGGNMPEGVGLRIMRHRAKAIGGRLTVRSGRRRGTAVICTLPRPGSDESMSDGG
jgi:signal transduction histidine kinase